MMNIEQLTAFFGWCSVINFSLLLFTTIMVTAFKGPISSLQSRMLGVEKEKLQSLYLHYLAYYKIAIIVFNIVPYFALKLIA